MSNEGYLHWSKQSAFGTPNLTGGQEIYCTALEPVVADITQARQPAVGGGAFPQDIYKAGTSGAFTATLEVPGKNIGYLLFFLMGKVAVTADTGPIGGAEVGVDTYTFTMDTDDFTLPWFTCITSTEDVILTQVSDCNVLTGRLVFGAGASLQATVGIAGVTPIFAAAPTPSLDTSPILVSSNTSAMYKVATVAADANQVIVDFTNVAATVAEEMKIGSPYRRGIEKLARACRVTVRMWCDATEYKAVYFGTSTTWSAAPYSAQIEVRAASGTKILPAGIDPYSLKFIAPEVGFLGCRTPQAGQRMTYMEMTGDVVIPDSGEEVSFILGSVADVAFDLTPVP